MLTNRIGVAFSPLFLRGAAGKFESMGLVSESLSGCSMFGQASAYCACSLNWQFARALELRSRSSIMVCKKEGPAEEEALPVDNGEPKGAVKPGPNEEPGPTEEVHLEGLWELWANDSCLRERLLKTGTLFTWPSKKMVWHLQLKDGCCECQRVTLLGEALVSTSFDSQNNLRAASTRAGPRCRVVCVLVLIDRDVSSASQVEVCQLRDHFSMEENVVRQNCEATVLRGFMTLLIRRHDGSSRRVT